MTTAVTCPGPCNAEHRRFPGQVEPRYGEPVWCTGCAGVVGEALDELPRLLTRVWVDAGRASAPGDDVKVSGTGSSTFPGEPQRVTEDVIGGGLVELEDEVRRLRPGFSPRPPRRWWPGLDITVAFLYGQLGWLLNEHPNAAEPMHSPGGTILRSRGRALRAIRADRHVDRLPAACPSCDLRALVRPDGSETVTCTACGRMLTRDDYGLLARMYAHEQAEAGAA